MLVRPGRATAIAAVSALNTLIEVESATIHVDDSWPDGTPLTHAAHEAAQKKSELGKAPVQVLGFFAPDAAGAKGVYTHHDRSTHLHLRKLTGTTMGHVDNVVLAPGARLELAWR